MPNWELRNCCNHEQVVFLSTTAVCAVVILALWRTVLLMPFKLVTVFLHEASHAVACKLTCGHVESIQVHADEGGITETRGGVYWFILPAGYLGSSFWGMVLILASTNLIAARIAAGCFALAMIIVLFVAKNWTLRILCICIIFILAVIWVLQETTNIRMLRYVIMFIGVMNSLFSVYGRLRRKTLLDLRMIDPLPKVSTSLLVSVCNAPCNKLIIIEHFCHVMAAGVVADIYGDLISRREHCSDAEKFAEECPCICNGVGWGLVWGLISLFFLCGAVYLGLVILSSVNNAARGF